MTTSSTTNDIPTNDNDTTTSSSSNNYLIKVSSTIPSLEECVSFVTHPSCGAISTFSGITRDNFKGKIVKRLSYEGYVPMAEKELRKVSNEESDEKVRI
jgi:molybdopterin synthase catalytic subunit